MALHLPHLHLQNHRHDCVTALPFPMENGAWLHLQNLKLALGRHLPNLRLPMESEGGQRRPMDARISFTSSFWPHMMKGLPSRILPAREPQKAPPHWLQASSSGAWPWRSASVSSRFRVLVFMRAIVSCWAFTFQNKWLHLCDTFRTFTFPWKTWVVMGGAFSTFFKSEWLSVGETFHAFTFSFQNLTNGS